MGTAPFFLFIHHSLQLSRPSHFSDSDIMILKAFLIFAGSLSLALAIAGMFLPVLPTTPFLLLSAACYMKSSPELYRRLMSHPRLGPYIRNFNENKAIPLRVKIVSVTLLWMTLLYCTFCVAETLWLKIVFLSVAAGVTIHILSYRTSDDR